MGGQLAQSEGQLAAPVPSILAVAERLDRTDILLLREFYVTGRPYPNDTLSHVLRLLVDKLHRSHGPLARLSYGAIRYRLENLVALGLLGRISGTNPAVYYPLDDLAPQVRRAILLFAADFVGISPKPEVASP